MFNKYIKLKKKKKKDELSIGQTCVTDVSISNKNFHDVRVNDDVC